ncbi:MAG TPA: hypothetical protein DCR43_06320 [Bacteroidales bacterium]|nr:MAG: hypothetical protein A2X11_06425 [Bacteroidetes bacterium GWE2_42_24]OFY25648.1 MAG: hypothetical protein A2X09_01650 [Bacteroidetes bacterium GWF2_43_11]HAQ65448.1 hypothetical protein [Bacteroidales bacterium]HBZ68094.1 hypothetical protein [Bacteroidales bacterium]
MSKSQSIHRVLIGYIIGVVAVTLVGFSAAWIWLEVRRHRADRMEAYRQYTIQQDNYLKGEMDKIFDFITLNRLTRTLALKQELSTRVNEAIAIADAIAESSKGRLSDEAIKILVTQTLRPIRFFNGRGYYFIVCLDGTEVLYPPESQYEGQNLMNLTDRNGVKVVKEEIETARKLGEGFVVGWWPKPGVNDTAAFPKTTFVKRYQRFNWLIGCGEYLDNIELDISRELMISLRNIFKTENRYGLVFDLKGRMILNTIPSMDVPGRIWNFADGHGLPIFNMLRDSSLAEEGGFLNFHFTDAINHKAHRMRLHARRVKEWNQVITLAIDSDSMADEISSVVQNSNDRMSRQMLQLILFISIIITLILLVSRWFSLRIQRGLNLFSERMTTALRQKGAVNAGEFSFTELQQLANSFNSILRQRERVMAELAESEQRYRMMASNVSDVIFTLTRGFHLSYVSPSVALLLGYAPKEAESMMPESFLFVQDHRRVRILIINMINRRVRNSEGERGGTIEMELRHIKGHRVSVEIFVNPVTDSEGRFLYLLGVARNIGERLKAQRDLLESEERYRLISSNVRDVIWGCNKYYEISYVSPAVFHLTGFSAKELAGASLQAVMTPESFLTLMNRMQDTVRKASQGKKNLVGSLVVELEHLRRDGSKFYAEINASVVFDDNGRVIGYNGITRDITERRKANDELLQSESKLREINASKDKFFSIIAHDLRNPFGALLGFSTALSDRFDDFSDSEKLTIINQLRFSSESAYRLIENLLEWSRTQTNAIEVSPTLFDISLLVNETLRLHSIQAGRKKIELINNLPVKFHVYADRNMIGTVLRNLISNAIKFSLERGTVVVSHETTEELVTILVTDKGIGIPAHNISKLFRIDEKIKTSGTYNEPGSGLGLILCREFILRNGGMIWVESTSGRGSRFSFCLPRQ